MTANDTIGATTGRPGSGSGGAARWERLIARRSWLPALLVLTVVLRLPMFSTPLSPDEGGFLYLAEQWQPDGSSLYGDHWVDRPPLLIAFFAGAGALGGATALRLLGCALAAASVLLAHRLGQGLAGSRAAATAAVLAAAATTSPLFGAWQVNGELVALPLVLAGLLLLLRPTAWAWCGAGALGSAAMLVKQNFADVLVVAVVVLVAELVRGHVPPRAVLRRGLTLAAGALAMLLLVLAVAALRGTTPAGLWDAVVLFRAQAAGVIATSASSWTIWRLGRLLVILLVSGAGLVVGLLLARAWSGPRTPWVYGAAALATWEVAGAFAGGSYWLHYCIGLVPALVLAAGLLAARPDRLARALRWGVALVVASSCVANLWVIVVSRPDEPTGTRIGSWLAASARPGDTAVVAFGEPDILRAAGLDSPYRELWSLPVRTRDPDLSDLTAVLAGPRPPTWLVVHGRSLATWGVDSEAAEAVARERYRPVRRLCGHTVLLRNGLARDVAPAPDCGPAPS